MTLDGLLYAGLSLLPTWLIMLIFAVISLMIAILIFKLIAFVMDVIPFI